MSAILDALLPVLLVIAAGHLVARLGIITGDQWRGVERVAYFLFFPSIVFAAVARTDFMALPAFGMSATLMLSVLAMTATALVLRPVLAARFGISGPRFTSIFQGSVRWNTFVAMAIAENMLGPEGLALLVVYELVNPTRCPECHGRGKRWRQVVEKVERADGVEKIGATRWLDCPRCKGHGTVRLSERDRAAMAGITKSRFNETWAARADELLADLVGLEDRVLRHLWEQFGQQAA